MSDFKLFMKDNKQSRSNTKFIPTNSLKDINNNPLEWEIKPLSTRENDIIRDSCIKEISTSRGVQAQFDHTLYLAKMIASSVIYPNLNDVNLQNSYGVLNAEDLVKEIIDNPAEYQQFSEFITQFNGYHDSFNDKIKKAKK